MTVEYIISDEQVKRLEALLSHFHQCTGMEDWTTEEMFQFIMASGSEGAIDARLYYMEQVIKAENETPAAGTAGDSKETNK